MNVNVRNLTAAVLEPKSDLCTSFPSTGGPEGLESQMK